ncbi:MAG: hypothetical protein LRY50_13965 [Geovibrio sp.]|nr:hypothetical protein [Geovibrio sp.]
MDKESIEKSIVGFSEFRLTDEAKARISKEMGIPLYFYDVRTDDDGFAAATIEAATVKVNYWGTVFTNAPIDFEGSDHLQLDDELFIDSDNFDEVEIADIKGGVNIRLQQFVIEIIEKRRTVEVGHSTSAKAFINELADELPYLMEQSHNVSHVSFECYDVSERKLSFKEEVLRTARDPKRSIFPKFVGELERLIDAMGEKQIKNMPLLFGVALENLAESFISEKGKDYRLLKHL